MQNLNRRGVIVTDVRERTRARQLLEPGTIIEQVNGEDITRVGQLITTLDEGPVRGGWEIVINTSGVRQRVVVR
jgi:PDZ domain-containing secreted protein